MATTSTFYVNGLSGNDNNVGSQTHPWKTINHAAEKITPGSIVLISKGTYHIKENIYINKGGTSSNPTIFKGVKGTIIDASALKGLKHSQRDAILIENSAYITLDNIEIFKSYRAGIRVSNSNHVTLRNIKSHNNGKWGIFSDFSNYLHIEKCNCYNSLKEHGIYLSNSGDYPIVRGNLIHDNYQCGLHINGDKSMGGDGIISYALIERNKIYNNGKGGGSGINCDGVIKSIIRNNLLFQNHASGISLYKIDGRYPSNDNQIYLNTVIVASDGRWALNLKNNSSKNVVYNNILLTRHPYHGSISTDSINGLRSDYNILTSNRQTITIDDENSFLTFKQWKNYFRDIHSQQSTLIEVFQDPSHHNYNLKPKSPAIDRANKIYVTYQDILGRKRPKNHVYDIGAYEYSA
jgi:hypothetical protein